MSCCHFIYVSLNVFSKVCMRHIYKLTFIYLQDDIDILVSLYIFFFSLYMRLSMCPLKHRDSGYITCQ